MRVPSQSSHPDQTLDIHDLVRDIVADPDRWMETPHEQLGGKSPQDLIGTSQEPLLRGLIESVKHGMAT